MSAVCIYALIDGALIPGEALHYRGPAVVFEHSEPAPTCGWLPSVSCLLYRRTISNGWVDLIWLCPRCSSVSLVEACYVRKGDEK